MCSNEINYEKLEENLKYFKKWLVTQEYLPKIDDNFLRSFIICCDYDKEATKSLIEKNFKLRLKAPEIFMNRDCLKENVLTFLTNSALTIMPKKTKDNCSVSVFRYLGDYRQLTMEGAFKGMTLISDLQLVEDPYNVGSINIHDLGPTGIMHLWKTSFNIVKKFMAYGQEAHPLKLKQIHIINVPYYWGKLFNLMKPFLNDHVVKMQYVHTSIDTLYEYVPRELLPEDYGGELGKMDDLRDEWLRKLKEKREFFLDDSKWMIDESKIRES